MRKYVQLLRIKNYIKNFLICLPFIFSGKFLEFDKTYVTMLLGFIAFCLSSSLIYIINDYMDKDKDKLHPTKCNRPLASGAISCRIAVCISLLLVVCIISIMCVLHNLYVCLLIGSYIILNILYSIKLKKLPIIDVSVLSLFFIIRVYYGAFLIDVPVSVYLYLTVMSVSFMMGVNKRKKEKSHNELCRDTLRFYSYDFLSKLSQSFMSLGIVFYSLWIVSDTNMFLNKSIMQISIFLVVFILMYYQYIIDNSEEGNPVDVLFSNPLLLCSALVYGLLIIIGFIV